MRRVVGVLALALLGVLTPVPEAEAHALQRTADPQPGEVLQQSPRAVTVVFTEAPEPALSMIQVLDTSGRPMPRSPAQPLAGDRLALRVALQPLPAGVYTVTWRVVSRVDGHATAGTFAFGVGVTPTQPVVAAVESTSPPPSPLEVAARWALYLGLTGLLGGAWVFAMAVPAVRPLPVGFLWPAWSASVAGVAGLAVAQWLQAGVDWIRLMETFLGRMLVWRAVPLVLCAPVLLAAGVSRGRIRALMLVLVGGGAAAAMFAQVAGGHAAASGGSGLWIQVIMQWAHFAAVGVWLGGLAALLILIHGTPDAQKAVAVRRFSATAAVALAAVAISGVIRAVTQVGSWANLITSPYGRVVTVKAMLLGVLAVLGAINRFRHVPAVHMTLHGLRRVGRVEVGVAAAVLAATALLTVLLPPAPITTNPPPAVIASGSDFATSIQVRLEIEPGWPGPNRFRLRIVDYDTDAPVSARRVSLRFSLPERPDIAPSTLTLAAAADGVYQGEAANISLGGRWRIIVVVEHQASSVVVPLQIATRSQPQRVQVLRAPGQPTLYIIDLGRGRSLQVYLDPGKPGPNQLHATFFTSAGQELPIPANITMTTSRSGSPPTQPPVYRFSPGHFVADTDVTPGDLVVAIEARGEDGETLQATLTLRI